MIPLMDNALYFSFVDGHAMLGLGSPVIVQINYEFGAKHMLDMCGILVPMNLIFRAQRV